MSDQQPWRLFLKTSHPFSLLHHTLTDLLITETNGSDMIRTNGTTPANIPQTTIQTLPPSLSCLLHLSLYPSVKPVCISISSVKHRGQQSEPDPTHTKWWEADKPGKQTSHSPMVHLMFPDLSARDVSFPHAASKKAQRRAEARASSVYQSGRTEGSTRVSSVKETRVRNKKNQTQELKKSKGQCWRAGI